MALLIKKKKTSGRNGQKRLEMEKAAALDRKIYIRHSPIALIDRNFRHARFIRVLQQLNKVR